MYTLILKTGHSFTVAQRMLDELEQAIADKRTRVFIKSGKSGMNRMYLNIDEIAAVK